MKFRKQERDTYFISLSGGMEPSRVYAVATDLKGVAAVSNNLG